MNTWKVILATVVIFGAGVLTGGLLVNYVDQGHGGYRHFPFWRGGARAHMGDRGQGRHGELPRPRSPEMWRKEFLGHLDQALKLTPDQRAAISKILAEGQKRNWEIWTNVAPKMRQEIERVHQRIRAQLDPEQQKKFDKMVKQFASHHPPHRPLPPRAPPAHASPSPAGGATGQ